MEVNICDCCLSSALKCDNFIAWLLTFNFKVSGSGLSSFGSLIR